jgi:hypothetical protein
MTGTQQASGGIRFYQIIGILVGLGSCLVCGFVWAHLSRLTPWTDPVCIREEAQRRQDALIAVCPPPPGAQPLGTHAASSEAGGWTGWEVTTQYTTNLPWAQVELYYTTLLSRHGFRQQGPWEYLTRETEVYGDQVTTYITGPPYIIVILRYRKAPANQPTTLTVIFHALYNAG